MKTETSSAGNSRGPSPGRAPVRGFTLLELLLVLALLGLMLALVPPALSGRVQALSTRGAALELAAAMRQAQALALRDNRPVRVRIDADLNAYRVGAGDPPRPWPADLALAHRRHPADAWQELDPDPDPAASPALELAFFPDGSSSGGQLKVGAGPGAYRLSLDWLLGRVEVLREAEAGT